MIRKEKRKKYRLDCYKDSPMPHYIEVIEGTEKQLDKAVTKLTAMGFNVVIKNFNQEELMNQVSKDAKSNKGIQKADAVIEKAKKQVGEKATKNNVLKVFKGKAKPKVSGGILRKCSLCGRTSYSAWSFVKVGKKMTRPGVKKLNKTDMVCRDPKLCKKK